MKCVEFLRNNKIIINVFLTVDFFLMPFTFDLCEHVTLVTGRCRDRPNEIDDTELCSVLKRVALKGSAIFVFFSWDFEALQF